MLKQKRIIMDKATKLVYILNGYELMCLGYLLCISNLNIQITRIKHSIALWTPLLHKLEIVGTKFTKMHNCQNNLKV